MLPSLVRKCADDVVVSVRYVVTVIHNSFQFPKISGKLSTWKTVDTMLSLFLPTESLGMGLCMVENTRLDQCELTT